MRKNIFVLFAILILMSGCFADYTSTPEPKPTVTLREEYFDNTPEPTETLLPLLTPRSSDDALPEIDLDLEAIDFEGGIVLALTLNDSSTGRVSEVAVTNALVDGNAVAFTVLTRSMIAEKYEQTGGAVFYAVMLDFTAVARHRCEVDVTAQTDSGEKPLHIICYAERPNYD